MGEEPWQRSKREITAECEEDEQAQRGPSSPEDEIDQPDSGFHIVGYQITPRGLPKWAVPIWRAEIKALKAAGARSSMVKAVTHEKVHDLIYLKECLKRASPKAKAAWKQYYPDWVRQVVEGIKTDREARRSARRDPSSVSSILASLTDDQKRTAESYRKLKRRRSRGTGRRARALSYKALAVKAWELANEVDAAIVRGLLVEKEGIAGLGQKYKLKNNGAVLERLRLGLDGLRAAIDGAKALKGPRQSARLNSRGCNARPDLIHIQ